MSEPLYGDPYDLVHRLEIVDIATGASEVKPVQEKMQDSEALGWIRPISGSVIARHQSSHSFGQYRKATKNCNRALTSNIIQINGLQ